MWQYQCTRCLRSFSTLTETWKSSTTQAPKQLSDDGDDFFPDEAETLVGDEIDLTEPLREALLLAVPMKILCSADCRGLCPKCGQPLAAQTCDCEEPVTDLRFAPLLDLFKKQEKTQERGKDNGSTKAETLKGKN